MSALHRSPSRGGCLFRLAFLVLAAGLPTVGVTATFNVNSVADVVDESPGDGVCRTAPGNTVCTLRAAIMESNALAGADTVNLQADVTYTLTRVGVDDTGLNGDLDLLDRVSIVGAGPASTIIDGNGAATGDRVLEVFKCTGNAPPSGGLCPGGSDAVVDISGVAIRGGRRLNGPGGGVFSAGTLNIRECAIYDNASSDGGGIGLMAIRNRPGTAAPPRARRR